MATYTKEEDVATIQEDDPKAREALREVFCNTARWSSDFNGSLADVIVNINRSEEAATITVKNSKEIEHSIKSEKHQQVLSENIASITTHGYRSPLRMRPIVRKC